MAHTDQPLKEGNIHISAPHIYGSVVEALELTPNSSLSFLNLGCGTGYLSCIVAQVLGPTSSNVGIEIHSDAVEHCRASIERWRQNAASPVATMDVIHGNALHIDSKSGEGIVGFDRIYIGASVEKRKLASLAELLRPGGILVGPGAQCLWASACPPCQLPTSNLPRFICF
jgi:protein-L-isoaspartate O-methyltransferase